MPSVSPVDNVGRAGRYHGRARSAAALPPLNRGDRPRPARAQRQFDQIERVEVAAAREKWARTTSSPSVRATEVLDAAASAALQQSSLDLAPRSIRVFRRGANAVSSIAHREQMRPHRQGRFLNRPA